MENDGVKIYIFTVLIFCIFSGNIGDYTFFSLVNVIYVVKQFN